MYFLCSVVCKDLSKVENEIIRTNLLLQQARLSLWTLFLPRKYNLLWVVNWRALIERKQTRWILLESWKSFRKYSASHDWNFRKWLKSLMNAEPEIHVKQLRHHYRNIVIPKGFASHLDTNSKNLFKKQLTRQPSNWLAYFLFHASRGNISCFSFGKRLEAAGLSAT